MSSDLERMSRDNVDSGKKLPRTKAMVSGIMERLQLLLQVTILPEAPTGITRSTSSIVDAPRVGQFLSLFRVEYAFVIVCVDGVASDFKLWRQPLFIVIICCLSVKTTVVDSHHLLFILCCPFIVVSSAKRDGAFWYGCSEVRYPAPALLSGSRWNVGRRFHHWHLHLKKVEFRWFHLWYYVLGTVNGQIEWRREGSEEGEVDINEWFWMVKLCW